METILNTILCRNSVIPVIAAWAGITGLAVAVWTLWSVRNVKAALENFRNIRLLYVRLPDHLEELRIVALIVADMAYATGGVKMNLPEIVSALMRVRKICENIGRLDETQSVSRDILTDLADSTKHFSLLLVSQNRKTFQKSLKILHLKNCQFDRRNPNVAMQHKSGD